MSIENSRRASLSEKIRFIDQSDELFKREFFAKASIANLPKGQHVCQEGSDCSHLAILLNGTARVYKLGENGKEITLYRVGPGESCILTASCILSNTPFPAFAICETDVEAALISASDARRWLAESGNWRDYIFSLVATRLSNIINVVEEVVFRRMDKRIAHHLCTRTLPPNHTLQVTHQEIASELGTSREVVSRILKELEQEGLIRVTRGSITLLDLPGLEQKQLER